MWMWREEKEGGEQPTVLAADWHDGMAWMVLRRAGGGILFSPPLLFFFFSIPGVPFPWLFRARERWREGRWIRYIFLEGSTECSARSGFSRA